MKSIITKILAAVVIAALLICQCGIVFQTFAAGSDYYGLFYDEKSDGGFEYGSWQNISSRTTAKLPSKNSQTSSEKHRGSKSMSYSFGNNKSEVIALYSVLDDVSEIDTVEDYCWTAYIKTSSDFKGKFYLSISDAENPVETGLKNKKGIDKPTVYDNTKNGRKTVWTRFDTSTAAYGSTTLKSYLTGKSSISIVLVVTGTTGKIWIDDIDFKPVSTLNDPEEVEREDNTGASGGEYSGIFDDAGSDGGFENNSWVKTDSSSQATASSYSTDRYVKNTGKRSAGFVFADSTLQTMKIYTHFSDLSYIDITQNYCWTASIKTTEEFDGKVTAKICAPNNYDGSGILNSESNDECTIFDSSSVQAHESWKQFNTVNTYYSAARISSFITENAAVKELGKICLVISVTATKGKLWIDDFDLKTRSYAIGDDDAVSSGDYKGLLDDKNSNGGFEFGAWNVLAAENTAVSPSKKNIDTAIKNSGSRSLTMKFSNGISETFAFRTNFIDVSEIDITSDYFWKAYAKSAAGFDGKISLSITVHNNTNAVLRNNEGKSDCVIFDSSVNGGAVAFSGTSAIKNRYSKADIKTFFERSDVKNSGIDIILKVTATTGMVWVDDIDFVNYNKTVDGVCLEDPDTAYLVDDGDYEGFFDSQSSNGGFEHGVWAIDRENSVAQMPSAYYTDTEFSNSGKRSLAVKFNNGNEEKFVFKMTSYEISKLLDDAYCLSAYLKTSADFKGTASLKITRHGNSKSALLNKNNSAENNIINNSVYSKFSQVDTGIIEIPKENIKNFKSAIAEDGCFDVYLTVTSSAGTIWFDDIDFLSITELEEEKNKPAEGAVYDGIIFNGGFENGSWTVTNPDYHSVETETENTYNESLKSIRINSTRETGYSGALKLSSRTITGKAATLDTSDKYCFDIKFKTVGSFDGFVYVEIKNGNNAVSYNFSDQLYLANDEVLNSSDWRELITAPFEITGEEITVNLYIDGVGTIILDDADIIKDPNSNNLLINGGFEYGKWGMYPSSGVTYGIDRTVTDNSPAAMYINGTGTRNYATSATVRNIDTSKDYKLTVSMKTVGMKYGGAFISVLLSNSETGQTQWAVWRGSESVISIGGTSDWRTYYALISDMPDWVNGICVYVNTESQGTLYIDNVVLTDNVSDDDYKITQPEIEGAVYSGNIYNGGFEEDVWSLSKLNDQNVSIDNETTHNNSKGALKIESTKRYGINKSLSFESYTVSGAAGSFNTEKEHCIELYLKSSDDFVGSVYVRVKQGDSYKWYNYETELHFLGTSNEGAAGYKDWTYLASPAFSVTSEDMYITLIVDGIGTVWIDDVSVTEDPQADNVIPNGGFENGIWSTWGTDSDPAEKVELVSDVTDGSAKAAKLSSTSDETEMFIVTGNKQNFDPKQTYKLSLSIKTQDVEMDGVYVAIQQWYTPEESGIQGSSWLPVYGQEKIIKTGGTSDWQTYSINVSKFDKDFDSFCIYVFLKGSGTAWVDNISMKAKQVEVVPAGTVGSDMASGTVDSLTAVHLYSSDEQGDIYYTTDGSDPKKSNTAILYNNEYGIIITKDITVKAFVTSEDGGDGKTTEFRYTCAIPLIEQDKMWKNVRVKGTTSLDSAVKKSGKNSIKIKGNGGIANVSTGHMVIDSNFDYTLDFWAKTDGMISDGTAYVSVFMASANGTEYYSEDGTTGAYFIDPTKMVAIKKTQDWTHYQVTIDGMLGAYSSLNVTAGINNDIGTLWIDNVTLVAAQHENHPITISGDDVQLGNIYDESTLSQFAITQGFLIANSAKLMETGKLKYSVSNDANPSKTISTGDLDIAVRGGSVTSDSIDLSTIAEYGTYTVKFKVENSRGITYSAGSLSVSRIIDNSKNPADGMLGICTNLYGETHYNLDFCNDILENYASAGIGMTRVDLDWEKVEAEENVFSMPERVEKIVDFSVDKGIEPIFILNSHYWPSYYSYSGASGFPKTDKQIAQFICYVKYVVQHFKGRVHYYELFNETNYNVYSGIDGAGYVHLLKEVYRAVKEIDPSIKLIGGVTSGIDYNYAEQIFAAGGADYMDYYSFHPYIQPSSPEAAGWIEKITDLRRLADKYGNSDLHFIITEVGWSAVNTKNGVTEQQKLNYLVRAFAFAKSVGYIDKIVIYNANCTGNKYYIESEWGIFGSVVANQLDFVSSSARPAAVGLAAFENLMSGYKFVGSEKLANGLYAHKYSGSKKDMYLLWTNDRECYADITTSCNNARVYDTFGNVVPVDYSGNTFNTSVGGGMVYLTVKKGEKITKVVLKDKTTEKTTETNIQNNNTFVSVNNNSSSEVSDSEKTPSTVKRIKKVVKKVITGKDEDDSLSTGLIVVIVVASVIVAGGIFTGVIIIVKRKKKQKSE